MAEEEEARHKAEEERIRREEEALLSDEEDEEDSGKDGAGKGGSFDEKPKEKRKRNPVFRLVPQEERMELLHVSKLNDILD